MIPVALKPEPVGFDKQVRQKGKKFLDEHGVPDKSSGFPRYWRDIIDDLHRLYDGICAYTCIYLVSSGTVDHFLPKSKYPNLAYEWNNYRLASDTINQRKGEREDILDPFLVQPGWFTMDFPSCLIKISNLIPSEYAQRAACTIDILKLNNDDRLVQERCDIIMDYVERNVTLVFLEKRYPFIATEIKRQALVEGIERIFKRRRIQQ